MKHHDEMENTIILGTDPFLCRREYFLAVKFCAFGLLLGSILRVSATEYEVDGQIEQTLFEMDGSVQLVTTSKFTVFVKDCSWLIQSTILDKAGKPLTLIETSSTNGGVIRSVVGKINKEAVPGWRNGVGDWNDVFIYSNNVPVGQTDDDFISHLWLMYGSGCYFANLSTNWLTPVYDLNASVTVNPNLKREAKWELINAQGLLPKNVVYLDEYDNHITNATYVTTGVTNAGELEIPSGFVFEERIGNQFSTRFAPGPIALGESAPTYRIRKRAVASVSAVRPVCSRSELTPQPPGKTMVIDQRLATATNTTAVSYYKFQNGVQWVSVEEAKKLAIRPPVQQKPSKLAMAIFYGLFILPFVALLFFSLRGRRKVK